MRLRHWLASASGQLQLLIILAVALGGGGVAYGFRNLIIQLAALLVLGLQHRQVGRFLHEAPRVLIILVLLTLALPLLQLVPLPPSIWQALPGREPVVDAFAAAGIAPGSWFPLSLDRGRTLTAFCGTLAPAAIIVIGATLAREEKLAIARMAAFAALAALLWGVVQVSSANTTGLLFPVNAKPDVLYASFANRNSTAALFVLALLLLASAPLPQTRGALLATTAGGALLALGAVLTQSRSGLVLLALALGLVVVRAGFALLGRGDRAPGRGWLAAALVALLIAGAAIGSAALGGRAADGLARFGDTDTDRPEMWEDAAFAARQYWPVGSGMGTFDEVFQLHESLEYITPRKAGRAHSDVLELAIEAGVVGVIMMLGWLVWCAQAALKPSLGASWPSLGAGLGVLLIGLQSLLDYPLRNQTLLCVAAVLVILLARRREKAR
jgi:O-antigen ligase